MVHSLVARIDPALLERVKTIVSHADCPDGIASALILRGALGEARVTFVEHNTPEQRDLPATEGMIFCDVVPPRERTQEFVEAGAIVLDHHRAARDVVESFGDRGVFADEKTEPGISGAPLAHREVWCALRDDDERVRRFATLAGIRDCWLTDHPDWEEAAAQSAALLFFGYEAIARELPKGAAPCLSETQMDVGRRQRAQRMATARETADRKLYRLRPDVAVYNDRDRLLSDVAGLAFDTDSSLRVVGGFHYKVTSDGAMLMVCSLRSRGDDVDVAAIAKRQGGGGHTSAAGFGVPVTEDSPNPLAVIDAALGELG
jgi:oligoribonuclease NrnB/cAMP/cGMP phosphodiesterase (DHH superfamily)